MDANISELCDHLSDL